MSITRSPFRLAPATEGAGRRPALVLVGHGSSERGDAFAAAEGHASRLAATGRFRSVATCYLKGGRAPAEVTRELASGDVFVLPLFMSEGHYARTEIPRALGLSGRVTRAGTRRLIYCDPLGASPALTAVIARRVRAVCRERGLRSRATQVLLVGHGSPGNPASRRATLEHARRLAAPGVFHSVACAFLAEAPFLDDVVRALAPTGPPVVAVGLFAAEGRHAGVDVPGVLARWRTRAERAATGQRSLVYAGAIGADPAMAEVILGAVAQAAEAAA